MLLFTACNFTVSESSDDEEDETEELTEFGELLQEKFSKKELPYSCSRDFDSYQPDEYLTEDDFNKLELFMIFPEGYEKKRYTAEDRINLETGVTVVVVTSLDNESEISTYAVTYNKEEWYVGNLRIGYENKLIDMKLSSEIEGDKILRKNVMIFGDEKIVEEETYFIQGDGDIVWEEDLIGDDV